MIIDPAPLSGMLAANLFLIAFFLGAAIGVFMKGDLKGPPGPPGPI